MTARRRAYAAVLVACLALAFVAFVRLRHASPALAELVRRAGSVSAAHHPAANAFADAAVGTEFDFGDAVRTAARSTARVRFVDASRLDVRPSTLIRFSRSRRNRNEPRLDVVEGEAWLSTTRELRVETLGGRTRIAAGSRVILRAAPDGGLELVMRVGHARIESIAGALTMVAGDRLAFASNGQPRVAADAGVPSATDGAPRPAVASGIRAGRIDLTMGPSDSLVVRDMHPPTAIGIETGGVCPGGAVIEWMEGTAVVASGAGSGTIPIAFPEGTQRFRVRCRDGETVREGSAGEGRVRILRSSGQNALPRAAPETTVDTDGRTYNVLYQNQSPALSVRWPGGPESGDIVLVAAGAGRTRRVSLHAPRHRFAPGTFADGTVRLHFEATDSGRRSRETRVVMRFDPSAPSASLEGPLDGSFSPGGTARVSGSALAGWVVRASGVEIPIGADRRFAADVPVPANGVLVVTLSRPGQGTHLYVRRARGVVR